MKKYLFTSVMVLALALTVAGTASAEGTATSSTGKLREMRQDFRDSQATTREDLQEKRTQIIGDNREAVKTIREDETLTPEQRREALKKQWEERKSSFSDLRQARMSAFGNRVAHRLEMAIERVSMLADRLDSRLAIMKGKGKDVTVATGLVAEARTSIEEAKVSLADFQSKLGALTSSTNPKDLVVGVKDASKATVEKIRAAHAKVVEAIASVKGEKKAEDKTEKDKDGDNDKDPDGDSTNE